MRSPSPDSRQGPDDLLAGAEERLAAVREKRGYLLPHHGLLAVADPELLTAYDAAYTALTLRPRHLDERRKEFVWLGILIAMDEAIATHHIPKFRNGGGTDAEIELAVRLTGFARAVPAFSFAGDHWGRHLPAYETRRAYRDALKALLSDGALEADLVEMTMAAIHACLRQWPAFAWHVEGAYAAGASELELAEAISLTMFPGSVPVFVDACAEWMQLIRDGKVDASPPFRAWAMIEGQGGYDEATGGHDR
ncbi:MAG: carboxymuconolactone decarboxylase family protein [Azospirillaceae bacterium]